MDSSPAQGKQSILFCVFTCLKKLATESCHQCKIAHQADADNCKCATNTHLMSSDWWCCTKEEKSKFIDGNYWDVVSQWPPSLPGTNFPFPAPRPSPHCTMQCTLHSEHCTLKTENWKLHCTLNTQNWNLNTEYWPLHSTVNTESTTVNTVQYKSTSQLRLVESTSADVLCFKFDFRF